MQIQENFFEDVSIFLVGVGGIGCEILKILIMTDMDQIELSNLNRQFLFRKEHIGKYKSEVAQQLLKKMNPGLQVLSYTKSIYEKFFDIDFYRKFDVVIMALDNQAARVYVNKMCHFSNIPILEGGTNSFKGQSMFIIPRYTQCYQCIPIKKEKSYQFCTIRSFPSEKIHCLVWAKTFFNDLCNDKSKSSIIEKYTNIDSDDKAFNICKRFFYDKVKSLKETNETKFKKLKLFDLEFIKNETKDIELTNEQKQNQKQYDELKQLLQQNFEDKQPENFDKDNELHVKLVCCLANLRAFNFNIDKTNQKETRKLIGNVTPAISSTNSLISGLMIFEFFKFIKKLKYIKKKQKIEQNQQIFLLNLNTYVMMNRYPKTLNRNLEKPYQQCKICSSNIIHLQKPHSSLKFLEQLRQNTTKNLQVFVKNELILDTDDQDDKKEFQNQLDVLENHLEKNQKYFYCISLNEKNEEKINYIILNTTEYDNSIKDYQEEVINLNNIYQQQKKVALQKKRQRQKLQNQKQFVFQDAISINSEDQFNNKKILIQLFQFIIMKQCAT